MVARCKETSPMLRRGDMVKTKLQRIVRKARNEPEFQFTSLFHLLNVELLRECFKRLRGDAAAGIDQVTKEQYAVDIEANLAKLVERLQRMAYVPQDVRRVYIPKPGTTKRRPLGIPCLEDKLVQAGMVRILECIYEQDFIDDSYGFRPGRSCHDALCALDQTVSSGKINWIVEADIKGFFGHVDHDWMLKFLAHRVGDRRVQRMVKRFLKAGIVEDGERYISEEGVPQGGTASPLLANIYLHYALDLWFEKRFKKKCIGVARLIRYADDFVACFQVRADAEQFRAELIYRLARFALEIESSKTKMLAFGPWAKEHGRRHGRRKPETFDFLGFTHYCSRSRKGRRFCMKRVTARKKFCAKLAAFKLWLRASRAKMKNRALWKMACIKLQGHYAYFGVTDNYRGIARYAFEARKLLFKWLNRQGGRRRMNWEQFARMEKRFPLPKPRIMVSLW